MSRNFYEEGRRFITCYVSKDGTFSPMGNAKDIEYAIEIAKEHNHTLCRLEIIQDFRCKNEYHYVNPEEHGGKIYPWSCPDCWGTWVIEDSGEKES